MQSSRGWHLYMDITYDFLDKKNFTQAFILLITSSSSKYLSINLHISIMQLVIGAIIHYNSRSMNCSKELKFKLQSKVFEACYLDNLSF